MAPIKEKINMRVSKLSQQQRKGLFNNTGIMVAATEKLKYDVLLCVPFILDILTHSTNKVIWFLIPLSFLTLFYSFYIFDYFYRSNYLLLAKFLSSWVIYLLILIVIIYLITKIQYVKSMSDK